MIFSWDAAFSNQKEEKKLHFFDGNRPCGADFDAALAAQTLIHIHWLGLAVFDLKNIDRTGIRAFSLPITLILIHRYHVHDSFFTSSKIR